ARFCPSQRLHLAAGVGLDRLPEATVRLHLVRHPHHRLRPANLHRAHAPILPLVILATSRSTWASVVLTPNRLPSAAHCHGCHVCSPSTSHCTRSGNNPASCLISAHRLPSHGRDRAAPSS